MQYACTILSQNFRFPSVKHLGLYTSSVSTNMSTVSTATASIHIDVTCQSRWLVVVVVVPEEMRNSTRLWIRRDPSLPRDSWQPFIDWGTTRGRLSLPTTDVLSTIVKRSMLTDVDKLSSCSQFSDSVVTASVHGNHVDCDCICIDMYRPRCGWRSRRV